MVRFYELRFALTLSQILVGHDAMIADIVWEEVQAMMDEEGSGYYDMTYAIKTIFIVMFHCHAHCWCWYAQSFSAMYVVDNRLDFACQRIFLYFLAFLYFWRIVAWHEEESTVQAAGS